MWGPFSDCLRSTIEVGPDPRPPGASAAVFRPAGKSFRYGNGTCPRFVCRKRVLRASASPNRERLYEVIARHVRARAEGEMAGIGHDDHRAGTRSAASDQILPEPGTERHVGDVDQSIEARVCAALHG